MKRLLVAMAVLAVTAAGSFAYEGEQTLAGETLESGGFAAPVLRYTAVDGQWGLMPGVRGAWIGDHVLSLGGAVYAVLPDTIRSGYAALPGERLDYRLAYGGLEMEYIVRPGELVHFAFGGLVGAGAAELGDDRDALHEETSFVVLEPGVSAVLNVTGEFRLTLGAHYRFVSGVNADRITNGKLSGPSVSLGFMFGYF